MSSLMTLDSYTLSEIEDGGLRIISCIQNSLAQYGAITIEVDSFDNCDSLGSLYAQSVHESLQFFSAPSDVKTLIEGCRYYTNNHDDVALTFTHGDATYYRSLVSLLGGERGWISRGASPSKADKEYFQHGIFRNCVPRGLHAMKQNIWPLGEDFQNFRRVKERQIGFHDRIHNAMLAVLRKELTTAPNQADRWIYPYEVICRETYYYPSTSSIDSGSMNSRVSATRLIRNPAHVDLSNGTLIHYADGLQLYSGTFRKKDAICGDEMRWFNIDARSFSPNSLVYLIGLATEISTRGKYLAAWHRVSAGRLIGIDKPRLSTVSFCNAGIDDLLEGGMDTRTGQLVYPSIARELLPVIGNLVYLEGIAHINH